MIETRHQSSNDAETDATTPVSVKKLGHVVFHVSDLERSLAFWTEIMGFKESDRNERGMVFLRHGADHHSIGLAQVDATPAGRAHLGFDHLAMEVGSVAELFRIREFLKSSGITIVFEGRRGAGCNPGIEFLDPDGNQLELYASMDQIGWSGTARPSDQWRRVSTLEEVLSVPVEGVEY